jgi:hypothetical protein
MRRQLRCNAGLSPRATRVRTGTSSTSKRSQLEAQSSIQASLEMAQVHRIQEDHLPFKQTEQFCQRVVHLVDDALFERDDRVIGDGYIFGANLGAALGDVTVSNAVIVG